MGPVGQQQSGAGTCTGHCAAGTQQCHLALGAAPAPPALHHGTAPSCDFSLPGARHWGPPALKPQGIPSHQAVRGTSHSTAVAQGKGKGTGFSAAGTGTRGCLALGRGLRCFPRSVSIPSSSHSHFQCSASIQQSCPSFPAGQAEAAKTPKPRTIPGPASAPLPSLHHGNKSSASGRGPWHGSTQPLAEPQLRFLLALGWLFPSLP